MRAPLWLFPLFALALGAQDADPKYMGVQAHLNYSVGDFKDKIGSYGFGVAVFTEHPFEDGYAMRLVGGMDVCGKGLSGGLAGGTRSRVFHFDVEGIKMLRPDSEANLLGPYLVAGVGAYGWEVVTGGTKTHSVRWGGSAGFGYRVDPRLDMEVRAQYSYPAPGFAAVSITAGLGLRF